MATITNFKGLPEVFVKAIQADDYDRGPADISVSSLVAPPRLVALREQHADELTEDASERLWALLGKMAHKILEQAGHDALTEERLFITVCPEHGANSRCPIDCHKAWTISGAFDSLALDPEGYVLRDHKLTSAWTRVYGSRLEEWTCQQNMYALLLHYHGFEVSRIAINAIYRDWSKTQALRSADYPQVPAEEIPLTLWPLEQQEAYLMERVRLHQQARVELPECTPEERWASPTTWAVMREGRKSALKVCNSKAEAESYGIQAGAAYNTNDVVQWARGYSIEERPGQSKRCLEFCPVRTICDFGKALKEAE